MQQQELLNSVMQYISAYGSVLIAGVILFIIFLLNRFILDGTINFFKMLFKRKKHEPDVSIETYHKSINSLKLINKINTELAVLLERLKADRIYIYEFHNGEFFFSNNPRYKISKTYEKTKDGQSHEIINGQDLDVSLYWDYLKPMFFDVNSSDSDLPVGVTPLRINPHCGSNPCLAPKRLYLYDISEMDINRGHFKIFSSKQHIFYTILSPILNSDGNILGFLGIDYTDKEDYKKIITMPDFQPCELCKFSARLSMSWESDPEMKKANLEYNKSIWKDFKGFD